ncbi:MAG: 4-alpha-glucanotransferase, partial [Actinomycetota bacterium]|nr:4-alpha-glucanotransferase [Actinomycetota bacterium]
MTGPATKVSEDLRRLAAAHGVATSYNNERREPVEVDADVVIRVLGLLDVEAGTEDDRRRELTRLEELDRAGALPPTVAVRIDGRPHPLAGAVALIGEAGARIEVRAEVPGDLEVGWFCVQPRDGRESPLVAAP